MRYKKQRQGKRKTKKRTSRGEFKSQKLLNTNTEIETKMSNLKSLRFPDIKVRFIIHF